MQKGANTRHLRSYGAMLIKKFDGIVEVMVRQIMERERAISQRKLCCLSGNVVNIIKAGRSR